MFRNEFPISLAEPGGARTRVQDSLARDAESRQDPANKSQDDFASLQDVGGDPVGYVLGRVERNAARGADLFHTPRAPMFSSSLDGLDADVVSQDRVRLYRSSLRFVCLYCDCFIFIFALCRRRYLTVEL
jgi:hypothetical protein